ncbi:hypothetical protein AB1Y20_008503 [Prymnesium parvum]|uniref:UBC core domain-containing protein n=1 Tax=Prymnesium parvum TaxID=97485 RepID=A0AB34IRF7_PRYPA
MTLRDHLAKLNANAACGSALNKFRLDEDTVTFCVAHGNARGLVSISLMEPSRYPQTGALMFADGTDELTRVVESCSSKVSEVAALPEVIRLIGDALSLAPSVLSMLLTGLGEAGGQYSAAASSSRKRSLEDRASDEEEESLSNDEDEEDDEHMNYGLEKGAELENQLLRLRHQWELKDQQRRCAANWEDTKVQDETKPLAYQPRRMGSDMKKNHSPCGAHQIFTAAEATRMLCNELFDLMKEHAEGFYGVKAECIDNDIHIWRVAISDFNQSPLRADMQALKARYGYAELQLELNFMPDMYPCYPAYVKIIRPRFLGAAAEATMSHPVMTLQGWDPLKRVKWLIRLVQSFLERHARVALDDPRNDPDRYPDGAYTSCEHALSRLELLAGVRPVWATTHSELYEGRTADIDTNRIRELNFGKPRKLDRPNRGGGWEAGVGYGHTGTEGGAVWDVKATAKAQALQDVEMREMLAIVTAAALRGEVAADTVASSCLRPLLWQELHTGSLLEVSSRPERISTFVSMLSLLKALGARPQLHSVLAQPLHARGASQPSSVLHAMGAVKRQAEFFAAKSKIPSTPGSSTDEADSDALADTQAIADLCAQIISVAASVAPPPSPPPAPAPPTPTPVATPRTTRQAAAAERSAASAASAALAPPVEDEAVSVPSDAYVEKMTELQFCAEPSLPFHHYELKQKADVDFAGNNLVARTKRLALEASDMLGGALPATVSSTIWARVNEGKMQFWRAMISGPEGTPYSAGMFVFDIFCPAEYPNVAPKVNLVTTGGGSVRFNPNLYNNGTVCLSLLGTWPGDQGESWQPKTSTLLQVLMSIQALILVPDPFFNEPGYERVRNTPEGDQRSRKYNETIREGTVRFAMIEQIRRPLPELKKTIHRHFYLRKAAILQQVQEWASDSRNSQYHADNMRLLYQSLESALASVTY